MRKLSQKLIMYLFLLTVFGSVTLTIAEKQKLSLGNDVSAAYVGNLLSVQRLQDSMRIQYKKSTMASKASKVDNQFQSL